MAQAAGSDKYAVRFAKAQSLVQQGDDVAASEIYQDLIKQDPSQPQAYNNLAAIKARHGELKQAQALLEQALRSNPVYAAVYDNLSAIYVEMARDSYGKALHLETPQQAIALRAVNGPKPATPASIQTAVLSPDKQAKKLAEKIPDKVPETSPSAAPAKQMTTVASTEADDSEALGKSPGISKSKQGTAEAVNKPEPDPASSPPPSAKLSPESSSQAVPTAALPPAAPPAAVEPAKADANTTQLAAVEKPAETKPVVTPAAAEPKAPVTETSNKVGDASEPAPINNEELVTTLQGWAAAWSAKAVDLYLSFYTDEYAPAGMTHAQWQAQRRQRLQAPKWIRVSLSDVQLKVIKADEVDVRLIQHYQADNYQDRTRKAFRLKHTPDGWRILEENTLATLR